MFASFIFGFVVAAHYKIFQGKVGNAISLCPYFIHLLRKSRECSFSTIEILQQKYNIVVAFEYSRTFINLCNAVSTLSELCVIMCTKKINKLKICWNLSFYFYPESPTVIVHLFNSWYLFNWQPDCERRFYLQKVNAVSFIS